jgi:hypothetical protein
MQFSHPDHSKSLTDCSIPVHQINLYITQWFTDTDNSNLYRHLKNETCYYINHIRSQDSAVSIEAMQWTRQTFLCYEASILPPGYNQPPIKWVMKTITPGSSGQGTKLTTHLHLVIRLWMSGAPLPYMTSWHSEATLPSIHNTISLFYTGHTAAPLPFPIPILFFNYMIVL